MYRYFFSSQEKYEVFDGFVVLHGTDTLAYTAAALSFMLENLGKPVVITGSQVYCVVFLRNNIFCYLFVRKYKNEWGLLQDFSGTYCILYFFLCI